MQVNGKLGHLICGKKLLPTFASHNEIEESRDTDIIWDDVISPFFDMQQFPTQFEPNRGFYDNSPFTCPQNLILLNSWRWKTRMKTGQGMATLACCFF